MSKEEKAEAEKAEMDKEAKKPKDTDPPMDMTMPKEAMPAGDDAFLPPELMGAVVGGGGEGHGKKGGHGHGKKHGGGDDKIAFAQVVSSGSSSSSSSSGSD